MQYFTQNKPWNNPVTVVYGTCVSSEKSALIPLKEYHINRYWVIYTVGFNDWKKYPCN